MKIERFEDIEQVHNCCILFEWLQVSSLSTWKHYFSKTSIYHAEYGNLQVSAECSTPARLNLASQVQLQKLIRKSRSVF